MMTIARLGKIAKTHDLMAKGSGSLTVLLSCCVAAILAHLEALVFFGAKQCKQSQLEPQGSSESL